MCDISIFKRKEANYSQVVLMNSAHTVRKATQTICRNFVENKFTYTRHAVSE